jgi:hypothetical protein
MHELENELDLDIELNTSLTKPSHWPWLSYIVEPIRLAHSLLYLLRPMEKVRLRGPGLPPEREHEWLPPSQKLGPL